MPFDEPVTRAGQKQLTGKRIIDAVVALIEKQGQFTVAEVATRSGISPATIYRHYPDRKALLAAVAREDTHLRDAQPQTMAEWRELLFEVWRWQEQNFDRILAVSSTPVGREMRAIRIRDRLPRLAEALASMGIDPNTPAGNRMLMLWLTVPSSRAFLDFREVFGLNADEASEIATWAVTALMRATREEWEIGHGLD